MSLENTEACYLSMLIEELARELLEAGDSQFIESTLREFNVAEEDPIPVRKAEKLVQSFRDRLRYLENIEGNEEEAHA